MGFHFQFCRAAPHWQRQTELEGKCQHGKTWFNFIWGEPRFQYPKVTRLYSSILENRIFASSFPSGGCDIKEGRRGYGEWTESWNRKDERVAALASHCEQPLSGRGATARAKLDGGVLKTDVQKTGAIRSHLAFVVLKGTAAVKGGGLLFLMMIDNCHI